MEKIKEEAIKEIVNDCSRKVNITDDNLINSTISSLCSMNENDAVDTILISLNDLLNSGRITTEEVFEQVPSILKLNPEKYRSAEDLIDRLKWIKAMNIEHPAMPLSKNHQLVIEVFDNFNELIAGKFDCYYTGGLMGYLATNHELERYHGDLDLFINEEQLVALKELIDSSPDFSFISNMNHKEVNGHEYKITYKDTPMSIGLFLFERQIDNSITTKEYYFENQNPKGQLFVDEHHFSKDYTDLSFSDTTREHKGIPYKMMSLESIYNSKKNSRPKDRYDAAIIQDNVNMLIDYKLDVEKKNNYNENHKPVSNSIIHTMEHLMSEDKYGETNNHKKR